MKLNLGSYIYPMKGYWNVDVAKWDGVDQQVDLNSLPWPFRDNSCEVVRAVDIIEHLGKITKVEAVHELARITKPGGRVVVRVPCLFHPTSFQSLQHAHGFYLDSFASDYTNKEFLCVERRISFHYRGPEFRFIFPVRLLYRIAARLGLVETIVFELVKKGRLVKHKSLIYPQTLTKDGKMRRKEGTHKRTTEKARQ